jgi:DNA-binding transcriptional regulator YbjK
LATVASHQTRERILRATVELIGREGISAVTNRRVAAEAGVALGSLTYHFASQVELLRESMLLFVGEEVSRQEGIAAALRRARPSVEQVAAEVERIVEESGSRMQVLAELELHLQAARDPDLREASLRCFESYEGVATTALEMLDVPEPERHAPSIVGLMYGMALRRWGAGKWAAGGVADGLLTIVRGARQ